MGSKSSGIQAPDPRLIEANIQALNRQGVQLDRIVGLSEAMLPLQQEQMRRGLAASSAAEERAAEQYRLALPMQERLRGLQTGMAREAEQFNLPQRTAELRGLAMADVQQQVAGAFEQAGRAGGRMGLSPERMAGSIADTALRQAQMQVAAAGGARSQAQAEQRGLTDRAVNALAGYPAQVTGAIGQTAQFGQGGLGITNTALGGMTGGFGGAAQGYGQQAGGYNQAYGTQGNLYLQDQTRTDQFWGSIIGAGAQLGTKAIGKYSDRRLKTDIAKVGRDARSGLNLYEFAYINDTSGRRYRGVMADEVERFDPEAVVYDDMGFAAVNYARLGIEMVEV